MTNISNKYYGNTVYLKEESHLRYEYVTLNLYPGQTTSYKFYDQEWINKDPNNIVAFLVDRFTNTVISNTTNYVQRYGMNYPLFLSISDYAQLPPAGYTGPYPPPTDKGKFYAIITNISNAVYNDTTILLKENTTSSSVTLSLPGNLRPGHGTIASFKLSPGSKLTVPYDFVAFLVQDIPGGKVVSNVASMVNRFRDL